MSSAGGSFWASYATFVATALLTATVVAALGYVPTVRLAGSDAAWPLVVGCGISWLASCAGAVPLALAATGKPSQAASSILVSTGVRFLTVILVVAPVVLSGWLERTVLVLWVGISYLLMLLVDSAFAIRVMNRAVESDA